MAEHPDLVEWALGQLDPAEARALEAHLDACETCRRDADELRGAHVVLERAAPPFEVPPGLRGARAAAAPAPPAAAPGWLSLPAAAARGRRRRSCSSGRSRRAARRPAQHDRRVRGRHRRGPRHAGRARGRARHRAPARPAPGRALRALVRARRTAGAASRRGRSIRTSRAAGPCGCWPPPIPWPIRACPSRSSPATATRAAPGPRSCARPYDLRGLRRRSRCVR